MLYCNLISPASDNRQSHAMHMPHCLVLGCVVVIHSDLDELVMYACIAYSHDVQCSVTLAQIKLIGVCF